MNFELIDENESETDPTGKNPHSTGSKLDAGKIRPSLVLRSFARALWAISEVGTFGANKYTDDGWMDVPNGINRYDDSGLRHFLKESMGEELDSDSKLEHAAHEAWNKLARLELLLRQKEEIKNATTNS